jgi:two-component system, cell cycle sensor histidine kinase and response regulator CckA
MMRFIFGKHWVHCSGLWNRVFDSVQVLMNVITQFAAARDYGRDLRFQAMFEGVAIGIGICQLDGRILEANPMLCTLLGYSSDELSAQSGKTYPGSLSSELSPNSDNGLVGELLRGERSSFEIEKRYQRKDGSDLWGLLTVSLGRDARRRPAFLIVTLADAQERKRIEAHLREAEKMEVIGRLAGGIAHDFNNLLTGILLYCDLLSTRLEGGLESDRPANSALGNGAAGSDGSECAGFEERELDRIELRQHVEEVRMAGQQGAALTHQLLAIARKQATEPRPVAINRIVASTENLLRRLIGEQITLVVSLDPILTSALDALPLEAAISSTPDMGEGLVLVDPAQLRQILMNLVLNARDAMKIGGTITLSTRAGEFPGAESVQGAKSSSSRRAISLAVKDDGHGMDAETRGRLFEPFFTTKNPGAGTGLGLATVQRIVSEAGGVIAVESEPGRGTCIEVFFPVIGSATPSKATSTRER